MLDEEQVQPVENVCWDRHLTDALEGTKVQKVSLAGGQLLVWFEAEDRHRLSLAVGKGEDGKTHLQLLSFPRPSTEVAEWGLRICIDEDTDHA